MGDENPPVTDLLGDPWSEPRDARGRKRHKRIPQVAEKVAVLRASGLTVEKIALRVGLSEPTLRKYYLRELEDGPAFAQAVLNEAMWAKALAGNVGAARYIREEFGKGDAKAADQRVADRADRAVGIEPVLGKKAERQAAAGRVTGRFATPSAPQLVVDNGRR
jgi:AraC-like DNA-binding protein